MFLYSQCSYFLAFLFLTFQAIPEGMNLESKKRKSEKKRRKKDMRENKKIDHGKYISKYQKKF